METARTVDEAEQIKQRLSADGIGLVLADVHLTPEPGVYGGYHLYERWSALHPTLPFLLMDGVWSCQDLLAILAGQVPFLANHFTLDSLLDHALDLVISKWPRLGPHCCSSRLSNS
ncbi:MAG: hypothetical protein ETSY1_05090 [Candidatus Entotheonella factor]|uniref:Response regulatory domain-containing protein n=1 Tax=Entotheonella factor TaxID=1429438 RepID=W4LW86_ENTF1|nr:MAG: hypothetical protein ETSY1_05090 [Candidatus Entotheonella factor]